ncbi:hypothetical protein [uncultured Flavobacterium sp.]|uniref:hypothetical protein n=1 Tax=uncultured Flavobacterium sp. TaxID=165435 RepID=UPI0030EB92DA|tara:strand:- start:144461 stop:145537 length:1077 start_codon:yes stop_codon:yes gene_type:complete
MQKIIFYTVIMLLSFVGKSIAQEKSFEERAKEIGNQIEMITKEEKKALKVEIEALDKQIIEGKISKEKAGELKLKIAEERASNIEIKVAIEEEKLNQLIQDKVDGKVKHTADSTIVRIGKRFVIRIENDTIDRKPKEYKERRTTSQFVFALGLNNLITEGENIEKSDFRVAGSHFYEWGITYNTRILKSNNLLHAKYGFSVMYNNLRPTDNRLFVKNGNQTELQTAAVDLKESRLRNVQLVLPLHLEFDFTPKKYSKRFSQDSTKTYFRTHESLRIGLGGYGGFNLKSKQITKYELDGDKVKDKQKGDFNTSDFVYGLSGYIGYGQTSLYVKYDMNPLFKDNAVDQNNISLGLRFDFN